MVYKDFDAFVKNTIKKTARIKLSCCFFNGLR